MENTFVLRIISQLRKDFNKEENNCIDILYGIQKYYSEILKAFTGILGNNIPLAIGRLKQKYLEMFLQAIQYFNGKLYDEMIMIGIQKLLKISDYQLTALHIINKSLTLIKPLECLRFFKDVTDLINNSPNIREVVYEILMFIYKNYKTKIEVDNVWIKKTGAMLLDGILDEDQEIRARLIKFWSEEAQLPTTIEKRMAKLLCMIHYSENDSNFLTSVVQLLLFPAVIDSSSKSPLFPYTPKEDDKHSERNIDTNWRRNTQFTRPPLFAETRALKATIETLNTQKNSTSSEGVNDILFTPTIDPDILFTSKENFKSQVIAQNSLFVETQHVFLNRRSALDTQTVTSVTSTQGGKSFDHLRKRFLKNKNSQQRDKGVNTITRRKLNQSQNLVDKKRQILDVTLYRRYRNGEFPDLNINSLAILLPLQALMRCDPITTRDVFIQLFDFSTKLFQNRFQLDSYMMEIGQGIVNIMNDPLANNGLLAALLNVSFRYPKKIHIPPNTVSTVAKETNNLSLGVLYLEERLITMDPDPEPEETRSSLSSQTSMASQTELHWLHLAELYRSMSEHDVLNGIFADKLESDSALPKAINDMASGRYDLSVNIWEQILLKYQHTQSIEQDFCFEAYYNCFASLADWETLTKKVSEQLTSMDDVSIIFVFNRSCKKKRS